MSEPISYDVLFIDWSQNYPIPLPTPNDIDGSEILPSKPGGARLVRMQQRFVMKFGVDVQPVEAYNMLYVAKSTTVPVPKVYAIYQRREKQSIVTYIVMQYVQGTTLLNLWGSLDQARKTSIAKTLRAYFDQLRQLKHPGFFGNINGGPPLDDIFSATRGTNEIKTSFATEDELIDWIIEYTPSKPASVWPTRLGITNMSCQLSFVAMALPSSPIMTFRERTSSYRITEF